MSQSVLWSSMHPCRSCETYTFTQEMSLLYTVTVLWPLKPEMTSALSTAHFRTSSTTW